MKEIEKKVWYTSKWDNQVYVIDIINNQVIYISYSLNHNIYNLDSDNIDQFVLDFMNEEWETKTEEECWILEWFGGIT